MDIDAKIEAIVTAVETNTRNIGELGKNVNALVGSVSDLTEIVVAMKGYMETNLVTKQELDERLGEELGSLREELGSKIEDVREELVAKIDGVQRSVDGAYERQSTLETRVTKLETVVGL